MFSTRPPEKMLRLDVDTGPKPGASPARRNVAGYTKLMRSFSAAGNADEVLRLLDEMKAAKCKPDIWCYNTVLNSLVSEKRIGEATSLFEDIISSGVVPDVSSHNLLIKMLSWHVKDYDSAYKQIEKMRRDGPCPNVITYSTLIHALCGEDRIDEAFGILDWMLEGKCQPDASAYTPIVQCYCRQGRVDEAIHLMSMMKDKDCVPSMYAYNMLINGLCKLGMLDEVEQILSENGHRGWEPNAITYNTYMDGLCKNGKARKALEIVFVMHDRGLQCTNYTLAILVNCLCYESRISDAKFLLDRSSELRWDDSVVGYNTIMSRFCDIGRWPDALKLMADMIVRGITPNMWTFGIFVHSLCIGRRHHVALWLIENRGSLADIVAYNTLLHGLFVEGNFSSVQQLIHEMNEKVNPDAITYGTVVDGCCAKGDFGMAVNAFIHSLRVGLSRKLFERLVKKLIRSRRIYHVLTLLERMERQGVLLNASIVSSVIHQFCRFHYCATDMSTLSGFLDKMLLRS